jgi:hypothetical protein
VGDRVRSGGLHVIVHCVPRPQHLPPAQLPTTRWKSVCL